MRAQHDKLRPMMTEPDRRAALLAAVAGHVLEHGLQATALKQLAAAAGTSDRMLLYYFKDKAELMAAVFEYLAAQFTATMEALRLPGPVPEAELRRHLAGLVLSEASQPFLRLWLEIVAASARGEPMARAAASRIGQGYLDWIAQQLDLPAEEARIASVRIFTEVEGLVLLDGIGLGAAAREAAGL